MTRRMVTLALTIGLAASAALTARAALKFDPPAGWVSKTPSSTMRVAEFTLPKTGSDAEDADVTVYFFGSGQGGTVQANLDRWMGQMMQPGGRASKDLAKTTSFKTKSGLAVTLLDVAGTYVAEVRPGSAERFNKPGFRLRAAVIETPGGPYFVKLTGPAATVAKWDAAFLAFVQSARE
jgi:hypothetical protein